MKIIDEQPDLVVCDFRMPGIDGRQLYEKVRARQQTRNIPLFFWPAAATSKRSCARSRDGVEEFITKPFFLNDLVQRAKKVIDRLQLEKLQKRAVRPGVIQGRLEEMSILDLMQSLEMGQKSCQLTIRRARRDLRTFFRRRASAPMLAQDRSKAKKLSTRRCAGPKANSRSISTARPPAPPFPAPPRAC